MVLLLLELTLPMVLQLALMEVRLPTVLKLVLLEVRLRTVLKLVLLEMSLPIVLKLELLEVRLPKVLRSALLEVTAVLMVAVCRPWQLHVVQHARSGEPAQSFLVLVPAVPDQGLQGAYTAVLQARLQLHLELVVAAAKTQSVSDCAALHQLDHAYQHG